MVNTAPLKLGPYVFEQVDEFKYLGVNTKNNMHNEIQLRMSNANKAYFAMITVHTTPDYCSKLQKRNCTPPTSDR
jgi:hypothetical protein